MGKPRDQGALPLVGDSWRKGHLFRVPLRFIFDCTMVGSLCGTATEPTPGPSTKPILKLILWCEGTLSEQPMWTGQEGVVLSRTDRHAPSQKGCCRALKDLPPYLSLWMPVLQGSEPDLSTCQDGSFSQRRSHTDPVHATGVYDVNTSFSDEK